jgi:hypothetical protein
LGLVSSVVDKTATAISGILSTASAVLTDPSDEVTAQVNNQLSDLFTKGNQAVQNTTKTLFGGSGQFGQTSSLPGVDPNNDGPNGEKNNIAKFFANGAYLFPVTSQGTIDSQLQPYFDQSLQIIQWYVIAETLKFSKVFIQVDDRSQDDCNGITSSAYIDGKCHWIAVRTIATAGGADSQEPLSSDTAKLLTDESAGYKVDLQRFYGNAYKCFQDHPDWTGDLTDPNAGLDDAANQGLPECYINIPVFDGKGPCPYIKDTVNGGGQVPSTFPDLGYSFDSCQTVEDVHNSQTGGGPVIGGHGP